VTDRFDGRQRPSQPTDSLREIRAAVPGAAPRLEVGEPIALGASGVQKRLSAFNRLATFRGGRLLDVGCGNGAYTLALAAVFSDIVAIDVEPERLRAFAAALARDPSHTGIVTELMSVEALSFADGRFDAITMIEVLEHVEHPDRAAAEVARVLAPGGVLYISVPNRLFPVETHSVVLPPTDRVIAGRWLPFLPYFRALHDRISLARNFRPRELDRLMVTVGLRAVGISYVMPPFDRWRFGRRWIRPLTDRLEQSAFGVFGVSIIAAYAKNP
jgi:ubiquinone/menaquinone biosynthesis C-methylase UbiE